MWNEILGALALLGMVIFCVVVIPATPKLVEAVCDRIRYGVQDTVDSDVDEQDAEQTPAPATPTAAPTQAATTPAVPAASNAAAAATPRTTKAAA